MDLRGGLTLEVCLGLLEGWNCDVRVPRMLPYTLLKGGRILPLEICMEVSRKPGQYWAPSYFPYISSSTHRILDKFGIYRKLSSRTIQRYLGRGDRTRTHEERGKLLVLII